MEHRELAVVGGWPLFRRNWSPEFLVIAFSARISGRRFLLPARRRSRQRFSEYKIVQQE
jgi:hypothetical protein